MQPLISSVGGQVGKNWRALCRVKVSGQNGETFGGEVGGRHAQSVEAVSGDFLEG